MARYRLNPVFDIETGKLLSHDGEFFTDETPILFDRKIQQEASKANKAATDLGNTTNTQANQVYSSVVPGIEQQANHPTGYSPTDLNNFLVSSEEGAGGAGAATSGAAKLASLRTRNAGGFAPALDEAARQRAQQISANALGVQNANADLKQQQQARAQQQLLGLYGTQTHNALADMGLANDDLNTNLAAGRQGWLQNTDQTIAALGSLGSGAGAAKTAFAS